MSRYVRVYLAAGLLFVSAVQSAHAVSTTRSEVIQGRQFYQEILKKTKIYDDPELTAYVNAVGQRMAKVSERPEIEYNFVIVDDPSVNAFAVQGGFIFVNRGLLAYLNSEDQLAAVLGHEIAHVAKGHSVRKNKIREAAQTSSSILSAITQIYTGSTSLASIHEHYGLGWLSGYGRDLELEADRQAVRYLVKTGYDPDAVLETLSVLKNQQQLQQRIMAAQSRMIPSYHGLYSSHPSHDTRLRKALKEAARQPDTRRTALEPIAYYPLMIDGLSYGPSGQSGFSGRNTYYNRQLAISIDFPDKWQTTAKGARLSSYPTGNLREAYIYVQIQRLDQTDMTPRNYLATKMRLGNPTSEQQFKNSDGRLGYIAQIPTTSIQGQGFSRRQAGVVFVDDMAYMIIGETRNQALFVDWLKGFASITDSIRKLPENEKFQAATQRLHLHLAKEGDSYADITSGIRGKYAADQIRLLNGDYPDGEPTPGRLIKVPK